MQLEVGAIVEGKVTGITKFSAFVELPGGKTGMVHISEIAPVFVNDIHDFVTEKQIVKVKILSIAEDGKIALSMKKAVEQPARPQSRDRQANNTQQRPPRSAPKPVAPPVERPNYEWQKKEVGGSFEDMMLRFKQTSDDKMSDLKRGVDAKRGSYSRGGHPSRRG